MAYKRAMRCSLGLAATLSLLCSVARAEQAQTPLGGEPPTAGVHLPTTSLLTTDASGIELNPAALAHLPSWSAMLHHAELTRSGRVGGGGDALFFGAPMPLLDSLAFGLGLQWLRPADAIGYADYAKLSLGLAWRPISRLSIGFTYHHLFCSGDPSLGGMDTLDLGLALRPFEWLGGAFVVRDVVAPSYGGLPLQRVYDLEVAARPFSSSRLEVGLGLRIGERRGDVDPRVRIESETVPGVHFFGQLEVLRRDYTRTGSELNDVRATVGFGFSLERVGLAVAAITGRSLEPGPGMLGRSSSATSAFQGVEATLRVQGARRAPMASIEKLLLLVQLEGALSERQRVALATQLREAERRPDVRAVLLEIDGLQGGWASVQELREHIKRLRRAGKKVYAFLRTPNYREYYLAAAADRVLLDPAGAVALQGVALSSLYFRGTFDLLGVAPQFVRIAEYKSAPEQYLNKTASPAAREMMRAFFDDLVSRLTRDLAADRGLTTAQVRRLLDHGPFTPPRALEAKLVDQLVEVGEVQRAVERASGAKLTKLSSLERASDRWPVGPGIAVVLVEGDIVRGKSSTIPLIDRRLTGDESVCEALEWARTTDRIKAVVLRVNSGGGSAWASDKIWRAVVRTRKVKPLIVSMGDYAASGGYYVAAGGERIYALGSTLTGSIGIFGGKFDLSGLMRKLGIAHEAISAGKHALIDSFMRPYTDEERGVVLRQLQYAYRNFLAAVGEGRGMTQDAVHRVARGRIWSGSQARARGLVDAEGGLIDALEEARRRAGLDADRPVRHVVLPVVRKGLIGWIAELLAVKSTEEQLLPHALISALKGIFPVLLRARAGEPLSRMPFDIELQ